MVYFISDLQDIKIGYTNNIKRRLSNLNTGNACKLYLLGYIEGDKEKEKELHQKFKKYKIQGEWFLSNQEVIDFINDNNLKQNNFIEKNSDGTIQIYFRMKI